MKTISNVPANLQLHERFHGCLVGGAVGDALAPVEFLHRSEILKRFGTLGIHNYVPAYGRVGAITDDTQLTLFTAEGMLRAWVVAGRRDVKSAFVRATAASYLRWLHTQGYSNTSASRPMNETGWLITNRELFSRRAPGATCISALRRMTGVVASNESKGCGGVMRVAPVGMFFSHWIGDDGQVQRTFQIANDIAGITHGHPRGQLTAGVFAVVVALLLRGTTLNEAIGIAKAELRKHDWHEETLAAIELAERLSLSEPNSPDAVRKLGEGWIAEDALAVSLYSAMCARDFESGVVLAVNHDGDSDSTGSITGNLLGSIHGIRQIPQRWLEPLELRTVIEEMADDLATMPDWKIGAGGNFPGKEFYSARYPLR
jgi:ADP-ribosylglycohydrolase